MSNVAYLSTSNMNQYFSHSSVNTSKDEFKAVKVSALRYLARREYSRVELYRKLSQKFSAAEAIQRVLDEMQEQGYQSDTRFTECYIRAKVNAGNGPFKIKIELREKGICESTALAAFDRQAVDWLALAQAVVDKKFANQQAETEEEQLLLLSKKIRFLKNKGFYKEHIDEAVKMYC
ncbi:regulatory protein RecX [Eionea flava]